MHNHHLLQIYGRPNWLTIKDGAKTYVDSVLRNMDTTRVHPSTPVTRVVRKNGKVRVTSKRGEEEFDHVIFATHADTALSSLADKSSLEEEVLGNFEFSINIAILHTDLAVHNLELD
jgi:uncharacterized protein